MSGLGYSIALVVAGTPGFCAHLAPRLLAPRDSDPRWYVVLHGIVNVLGGNYGRARNADTAGDSHAAR